MELQIKSLMSLHGQVHASTTFTNDILCNVSPCVGDQMGQVCAYPAVFTSYLCIQSITVFSVFFLDFFYYFPFKRDVTAKWLALLFLITKVPTSPLARYSGYFLGFSQSIFR
jgi:hypothetical protein